MKRKEVKTNETNEKNKEPNNSNEFKSFLIKKLMHKYKNVSNEKSKKMPKDYNAINLSDIFDSIINLPEQEVKNVILDINSHKIAIDIDSDAIKLLNSSDLDEKNKEKVQNFLNQIGQIINIDINSISELSTTQFNNIKDITHIFYIIKLSSR